MLWTFVTLCAFAGTLVKGVSIGSWTGQSGSRTQHDISGTVSFLDTTTILLENFNYDGNGITVLLYYYRPGGPQSGRNGFSINNDASERLVFSRRTYSNEDVTAKMPAGQTVCDIQTLTVWCEPFNAIFAQVVVDREEVFANGGSGECQLLTAGGTEPPPRNIPPSVYPNCIPFSPSLQVSWSVDSQFNEIDFQLCGCISTQMVNQYMGFGLSGRTDATFMVGADATITWVDITSGSPNAVDYHLTGRFQCRGGAGVCPDTLIGTSDCTDNVRPGSVTGGLRPGGVQCVAFSRPFTTNDTACDINFDVSNQNQFIVWAIGGLGATAFIHLERANPNSPAIYFNRTAVDQCNSTVSCIRCPPFSSTTLSLPTNTTLIAYIGPSGQDRGYTAITGQPAWGIAWYINGTLIPELEVQRGQTYTFIVEGGNNPSNEPQFHPFYITDSIHGGRLRNTAEQQARETVYAGFNGSTPIGVGRLCEQRESQEARTIRETCGSFSTYESTLIQTNLTCDSGEPGVITWTPDEDTPDVVYYQCATHLNLGWRINVRDIVVITTEPKVVVSTKPSSDLVPPEVDVVGDGASTVAGNIQVILLIAFVPFITLFF